ncbi:hypothetical protein NE237_029167 [Protea cynaroides]|uniref:Uncharacterized protein n=1 Tax=Protea cynaroides TaxID=273540 RepID=A0A9Q0GRS2_9MAGN|nr:hypothetical protein NE237_029167 [Protea cynaroides]
MTTSILSFAQKLALMIASEADFLSGVSNEAQSLSNEMNLMSSALRDASEKRRTINEVKEWVNQVRDAVMVAEDVIDLFIFEGERQRHTNFLKRYIYPKQLYILHNLGREIEKSNKKINQLSVRRSTLGLATSETGQNLVGGLSFHRGDWVEEFFVVGFQKEENEIVKKLQTPIESLWPCPTVVSVVGMGGSGKTTLARKVYRRNDVKRHFQTRVWISVSQQYNIRDLLHVLIEQIMPLTSEEKKELDVEILIHRLSSHLKETTYLIVFDDLWRPEDWDMLKQALPIQGEGYQSRVLVTTRNEVVARYADPNTDPYFQRLLNENEGWELFLTKVMGRKDVSCPKDLEDLGRKIVHKCHGLPLAIVVLGGLLSLKPRTHIAWSKVVNSVNWELNKNERSCQQVLALSYTDLPDHLRPCFLYLGLFPEDSKIQRYRLIWLWVAEGFIQPREGLTTEDVAEDYMEELIQRSLIQATSRGYDGRVTNCHIHDLIRDLAISEAKQERFLEVVAIDNLISPNKSRRLSLVEPTGGIYGSQTTALNQGTTPNHIRSLLCFYMITEDNKWMMPLFGAMKLLRVLDLQNVIVSHIPSSLLKQIGKLFLLNYFSLRGSSTEEKLPFSIGDLQNLQTLDLGRTNLTQLPKEIVKLEQLRNLVFYNNGFYLENTQSFNCCLDHMKNLRTLVLQEGKWIKGRLDRLSNLRELCIVLARSMSPYKEALLNVIPKLNHLRGLSIISRKFDVMRERAVFFPVSISDHLELYHMGLDGITGIQDFPSNLTTLSLSRILNAGVLMESLKKLTKLRRLILREAYLGFKIIFSADGFCQLEELVFFRIYDLEFTVEKGALMNLRVLKIEGHELIRRLPPALKQMVALQELTLSRISKELENRVRKDAGEDWEIIKHIPSIVIESYMTHAETYDFGERS